MRRLRHGDETIKGFIHYGGLVSGALLLVIGLAVAVAGVLL
jgi:hypothetical protein